MRYPGLDLVVVDNPDIGPHTSIGAAISAAKQAPGASVWIPASYTGSDAVPTTPGVAVFDMRGSTGSFTGASSVTNDSLINGSTYLVSSNKAGQIITDGDWTNGSSTLNSNGAANWDSSLIGQSVFATQTCTNGLNGNTTLLSLPLGTITAVPSSTQLTVSTTTVNTPLAAHRGCIVIGQLQDTAMAAISTAVNATQQCPVVSIPAGVFLISAVPGFLKTQPNSCINAGPVLGFETTANGGYLVTGQGSGQTTFVITPSLTPTACVNGNQSNACFVVPQNATWKNFRITGAGIALNGRSDNTKFGVQMEAYTVMDGVLLDLWGTGSTGFVGLRSYSAAGGASYIRKFALDSFGYNALSVSSTLADLYIRDSVFQNVCGNATVLVSNTAVISTGGTWVDMVAGVPGTCNNATNRTLIALSSGATWTMGNGDLIYISVVSGGFSSVGVNTDSTSVLYAGGAGSSIGGGFANIYPIQNNGSTYLLGGGVALNGTNATAILNNSGGKVYDFGYTSIAGGASNSGTWINSASAAGGISTTSNFALTSGWGTSTVPSAAGDSHRSKITITTTVSGSANPVLTWTFVKPYQVAPQSCTIQQTGGTFGVLSNWVVGTPTTTGVTFTPTGTPTANSYILDLSCGP